MRNYPAGLTVDDGGWGINFTPVEGGIQISARSRARAGQSALVFLAEEDYDKVVVLRRGFNARSAARIEGEAVAWSYADGHGMELVAVLRRGKAFQMWLPGHHDHSPGTNSRGQVKEDGSIEWTQLPSLKKLEL